MKLTRTFYCLGVLFALVLFVRCDDAPKVSSFVFESAVLDEVLNSNDDFLFRKVQLGFGLDSVKVNEKAVPVQELPNKLVYATKIDSLSTYELLYTFDEANCLSEIQASIYMINDVNVIDDTFEELRLYYTTFYGESVEDKGLTSWVVRSDKYGEVNINISQESPSFSQNRQAHGKMSIWIYQSF